MTLARLVNVLPVRAAASVAGAKARRLAAGRPLLGSTLQSLRRGRPTEIGYLNGEVVRLGQELGVPTPFNAAVVDLVHRVEETARFWEVSEVRRAVGAIQAGRGRSLRLLGVAGGQGMASEVEAEATPPHQGHTLRNR